MVWLMGFKKLMKFSCAMVRQGPPMNGVGFDIERAP